jgi:hypothetical protein
MISLVEVVALLMAMFIRDVAELEEVYCWKPDKLLPHSVLLASKQNGGDWIYTAKSVGPLVQVDGQR